MFIRASTRLAPYLTQARGGKDSGGIQSGDDKFLSDFDDPGGVFAIYRVFKLLKV